MNQDYLLTIGIPTYNGEITIRDSIESIISQFSDINMSNVELLISDNNSNDLTVDIANKYKSLYPNNIRIVNNRQNDLKLDGNLLNLFKNAKGQFVWILSDDDVLEKIAINYVINIIKKYKNDLGVIMTNYSECDYQLQYKKKRYREDILEDIFCENGDDFFIKSKLLFGLISSLIIKRDSWLASDFKQYIGLNSLHVAAIIQILNKEKSFIISNKLVKFRMDTLTGKPSWGEQGAFIIIAYQHIQIFHSMRYLNYKKETIDFLINTHYRGNYFTVALAKAQGFKDTRRAFSEMKKCYQHKFFFWIFDVPILFMPSIFFKILYKLYKFYKKIIIYFKN